jgi:hypothetical protein
MDIFFMVFLLSMKSNRSPARVPEVNGKEIREIAIPFEKYRVRTAANRSQPSGVIDSTVFR